MPDLSLDTLAIHAGEAPDRETGAVSHAVGLRQELAELNLRAGFQGAATVLQAGGALASLVLLRTAPADMRALREYIAQRAVAAGLEEEEHSHHDG